MKQYGQLAAVFGVTLAVLLVGFLVLEQLGATGPAAVVDPSGSPSPSPVLPSQRVTARPVLTPVPTAARSASASSGPAVTAAPSPPRPTPTPRPSRSVPPVVPGKTTQVIVKGNQYVEAVVPSNAQVTKLANGAALLTSDRMYSDPTTVTYRLPASSIPAGSRVSRLDVAVCGDGSGDFWETYGPSDMEPIEHEVEPPGSDGCWHYEGGSGSDSTVLAIIHLASRLQIDELRYTITTE